RERLRRDGRRRRDAPRDGARGDTPEPEPAPDISQPTRSERILRIDWIHPKDPDRFRTRKHPNAARLVPLQGTRAMPMTHVLRWSARKMLGHGWMYRVPRYYERT